MSKKILHVLMFSGMSLILASNASHAAASSAASIPGPWQTECHDQTKWHISDTELSASCPIGAGSIHPKNQSKHIISTVELPCNDKEGIRNCEGMLWCGPCPSSSPLPGGNYLDACEDIKISLKEFSAKCAPDGGGPKIFSSLRISCKSKIMNCNGQLTCGPCPK